MRHPLMLRHKSELYRLVVTGDQQELVVHSEEGEDVAFSVFPLGDGVLEVTVGGRRRLVHYAVDGEMVHVQDGGRVFSFRQERHEASGADVGAHDDLRAPMPGQVTSILVKAGQRVEAGQALYALEAMKMETLVRAPCEGVIARVLVEAGSQVDDGAQVVEFQPHEDAGAGKVQGDGRGAGKVQGDGA
ncbi:MAG: biotin/lipoyl-binding protein [Deltaproteobacteria bacterium]|nr:biotin/lipoyl-binding protein [Deltaproteobacteria bacterium]